MNYRRKVKSYPSETLNWIVAIVVLIAFWVFNDKFSTETHISSVKRLGKPSFVNDIFETEVLTGNELRILNIGKNDFCNGKFIYSGKEYRLFQCVWRNKKGFLAGKNHNPDYCWKYAGWNKVDSEIPLEISNLLLEFNENSPFKANLRVFYHDMYRRYELVSWVYFSSSHEITSNKTGYIAETGFFRRSAQITKSLFDASLNKDRMEKKPAFIRISTQISDETPLEEDIKLLLYLLQDLIVDIKIKNIL